jgi:tetratricopeptide (TPR) repeat protein
LDTARECYLQIQKLLDSHPTAADDLEIGRGRIRLRLGEIHGALGEHGASEDALNQALQLADVNDREVQGKAHKLLGDLAVSQDRFSDALKYFEKARDAYRNLGQARPFVATTSEMGRCALMQGRAALAEDLSRQALEMAHKLKDPALIARVNRHLGQVLTRRGRFIEAIEHLQESEKGFETSGRDAEVIECLAELGNAAFASGRYTESREFFTRAIATSSALHLISGVAAHLGLARALAALGNLEQSEAHLAEALAKSGTAQDLVRMAEVYLYQGDVQLAANDHTLARKYYNEVVDIAETIGQMRLWIDAVTRLSYVELDAGNEDRVFEELNRAMQQCQALGDHDSELQTRAHIIYIQMLQHGFPRKGDTFSLLLENADESETSATTVLCYLFRSDVEAARGNYGQARDYLRYAHVAAAQLGDFSIFIPIARRTYLLQKELGQLGDPHSGSGFAIGALLPPEVGARRFVALPTTVE